MKTLNPLLLWGFIGGLLALAIIVVVAVSSSAGGNTTASLTSVASKLDNLKKVTVTAEKNVQSTELRTLNSNLTLALTNTSRDLAEPIKTQKINLKDASKNPAVAKVTKEFEDINTRLEDARLNAVYDRTYAREMAYALKQLNSDMAVLYKSTRSKTVKTALDSAQGNFKPVLEGLQDFNAS